MKITFGVVTWFFRKDNVIICYLRIYTSIDIYNVAVGRLEAGMQRLTNLCSVLNDMEPICVLNHAFVLREVSPYVSYMYGNEVTCSVLTSDLGV